MTSLESLMRMRRNFRTKPFEGVFSVREVQTRRIETREPAALALLAQQ